MNSTGEKTGYRVILVLVVGLTAFSSAMKELNQVQQLSLDISRVVAQWSDKLVPAEVPPQALAKLESCEMKQSKPSIELPWLTNAQQQAAANEAEENQIEQPAPAHRATPSAAQIDKVKKLRRLNIDPVQFEVRIPPDRDAEPDEVITSELPLTMFKAKSRKHGAVRINPRDREILLKTLNRSINLRIAS
jgi:hypothetical protein